MKNKIIGLIVLVVIAALIVVVVANYWFPDVGHDEGVMKCIGQNSVLYASKICRHCAQQKQILGDYLDLFNVVECTENQQACVDAGVEYVPTWVINGERHVGVFEIDELRDFAGC
jgi:hypothetical protein